MMHGGLAVLLAATLTAGAVGGTSAPFAVRAQQAESGCGAIQVPGVPASVPPCSMKSVPGERPAYVLGWEGTNGQGDNIKQLIAGLRQDLGLPAGYDYTHLPQLLSDANRFAEEGCRQATTGNGALVDGVNPRTWFCLNSQDSNTSTQTSWSPQGITGTWDSHAQGTVDGERAFAFSWHYTRDNTRSRVTFLAERPWDFGSLQHKYRHVLLVRPYRSPDGHVSYRPMPTHAGGMVWYHQYLLVADEPYGILIFDTHNLLDMTVTATGDNLTTPDRIGRAPDGQYYSFGYRYILPVIGRWVTGGQDNAGRLDTHCHAERTQPCYSFLGLDRSTSNPSILTGEWCDPRTNDRCAVGRVARYGLAADNTDCLDGCLATAPDGMARAAEVYTQPSPWTQGGISWQGHYFFTESHNNQDLGTLFTAAPGQSSNAYNAGIGVQDLYWHRGTATPVLWSLTEFARVGRRVLYGVTAP